MSTPADKLVFSEHVVAIVTNKKGKKKVIEHGAKENHLAT